jgi:1-acyl-sn-glycerol-3-phosphate acyltransferase
MFSAISQFILRIAGWKITGWNPNDLKKYLIIVIPHTSNWDFPVGLLIRSALKAYHLKFLGKKSLFRPPYGWIFRALGGYPVDRSKSTNLVDAVVHTFDQTDELVVTLAPEGTRSKVDRLKTGFYYIALGAKIPIVMVQFDYGKKVCHWSEPFYPSGDKEADFKFIDDFFRGVKGKNPEQGYLYSPPSEQ